MVLVGKVNKEIVLRLSRHGQPAVGLCGDDGSLFRVARRAAPGGEDIGFVGRIERVNVGVIEHVASDYIPVIASVGADREGNSYNVNADEAAGAVAGALAPTRCLPDRRRRLAARPGRPGQPDRAATRRARRAAPCRASTAACARSSKRAWRRSTSGVSAAHILDGRTPHSLLLELFTDAGHRHQDRGSADEPGRAAASSSAERDPDLRAPAGGVRARRGRAPVGRRGQRVPGLPVRHLGDEPRALPPARRRGRARAGRDADARLATCSTPSRRCAWPQRLSRAQPRRQGVLLQLRRGGDRGGDQARAQGARRAATSWSSTAPSTGAPTARCRRRRRRPSRRRSRRWSRASARSRPSRDALRAAVDERTAAVLLEPIQGESGVHVLSEELLRAAREACDAHGAALIFDEIQCGMGRTGTLWAYEQTGVRARRDGGREGAGRRPADRRAGDRRAAGGRPAARAITARRSPAAPWSPRPRWRRSS